MRRTASLVKTVAVGFAAIFVSSAIARAQSSTPFYKDKTLRIIVPTGSGGDRALYTLLFANYYGKHIPGHPKVLPVFMPGAGGSVGLNYAYSVAQPDGLTIVTPLTSVLSAEITRERSVKYDARRFKWIGRTADATRILYVTSKIDVKNLQDLRRRQVVVGSDGQASETYRNAAFMNDVFHTKFKIITGYDSAGSMNMAVETGETQGAFTTWDDLHSYHPNWIRDRKVRILLQIGMAKNPALEKVPLLLDLATTDGEKRLVQLMSSSSVMGQSFAAPPGVPDSRLGVLRTAFDATMKDKGFLARAQAAKMHINPMGGADLTAVVASIVGTPPALIDRYRLAVTRAEN